MKMLSGGEQTHNLLGYPCDNVHLALSHISQKRVNAPHAFQPFTIQACICSLYPIIMLCHSVRRRCALPGNSVNLIHSADLRGTEMTWQRQSRVLQYVLLLAELLGRPCTFLDSCLRTLLGKGGELALWPHCKY